jgi:hypothetical protein
MCDIPAPFPPNPCNSIGDYFLRPDICATSLFPIPPLGEGVTGSFTLPENNLINDDNGNIPSNISLPPNINVQSCCTCGTFGSVILNDPLSNCEGISPVCNGEVRYTVDGEQFCYINNAGLQAVYQRASFHADPLTCCLKNNVCNSDAYSCYEREDYERTCAPEYRDVVSDPCYAIIEPICAEPDNWLQPITANGVSMTCNQYIDHLIGQYGPNDEKRCLNISSLQNNVQGCQPIDLQIFIPNAKGYSQAKDIINRVISKYNNQGYRLGADIGDADYGPFQDAIKQTCCKYPDLCKTNIIENCQSIDPLRINYKPREKEWCGCYLPDSAYEKYINVYGINKECTPYCNGIDNIPTTNVSGSGIPCRQNVCLIDDVTINIINSDIGQINIGNFCGGCQSANQSAFISSCICIIDNNTINIINEKIGGQVNIVNQCGSTKCTKTATPEQINKGLPSFLDIPCDSSPDFDPFIQYEQKQEQERIAKNSNFITIFLIALFVVLAIFFLILFFKRK